jgi:hypothetical protein
MDPGLRRDDDRTEVVWPFSEGRGPPKNLPTRRPGERRDPAPYPSTHQRHLAPAFAGATMNTEVF